MPATPSPKGKAAPPGRAKVLPPGEKALASRDLIAKLLARGVTRKEAAARLGLTRKAVYALFPEGAPVVVTLPAAPVVPVAPPPPPPLRVAPVPVLPPLPPAPAFLPSLVDGHLIGFDYRRLPPPLPPEAEAARRSLGWCQRLGEAARIEDIAAGQCGHVRAGLLHLADLHRHHPRFYPEHHIPPSDLPARYVPAPPPGIIGSIGQLCAEG